MTRRLIVLSDPLSTKLYKLHFHPIEVVSRYRDTQLKQGENYLYFSQFGILNCFTANLEYIRFWSILISWLNQFYLEWNVFFNSKIYKYLVWNFTNNNEIFHPLEVVCRSSDTQLQVGQN